MSLKLKTEKQDMSYLNYSNALRDCFGFHIAESGNIAILGNGPGLIKEHKKYNHKLK